jgi:histidinol-phosphate phosphatase family protein
MKKYDTIFLDRDGTLNFDPGYISNLNQFELFDFCIPALKLLSDHGNRFCIVTNQSGVSRGLIQENDLQEIHDHINKQFEKNYINLLDIYVCYDHPDSASDRRKPGVGMFLEAAEDHEIDLQMSLMIGDDIADVLAAKQLGMDSMLVLTGRGHRTRKKLDSGEQPTYIVQNLLSGAQTLLELE